MPKSKQRVTWKRTANPAHETLNLWVNGALAGTLVVRLKEAELLDVVELTLGLHWPGGRQEEPK